MSPSRKLLQQNSRGRLTSFNPQLQASGKIEQRSQMTEMSNKKLKPSVKAQLRAVHSNEVDKKTLRAMTRALLDDDVPKRENDEESPSMVCDEEPIDSAAIK